MSIQKFPGTAITGTLTLAQFTTAALLGGPKITSVVATNSSYVATGSSSVDPAGGYISILGSGFDSGCTVIIGSLAAGTASATASAVAFVNSTQINVQVPARTAGSYTLYVVDSDGGTTVRVNGLNYSILPTWSSSSSMNGVVNSPISIQLASTSDSNIVYSLQAGSTLPSGVVLSTSGLLSGTVTGIINNTTYNFTVLATDVELQATPRAFSISITVVDPYYVNTALFLNGKGIDQSSTVITDDISGNLLPAAVVGSVLPSSRSPFATGGSAFFGSSYMTVTPGTALQLGTSAFTVECWTYLTSRVSSYPCIFGNYNSYTTSALSVFAGHSSGTTTLYQVAINGIAFPVIQSTSAIAYNTWVHVAVVRNSGIITLYINGVANGTYATATDLSGVGTSWYIGTAGDSIASGYIAGYISNFRVTTGPAYTAAFTPPTSALTTSAGLQYGLVEYLLVAGGGGGATDIDVGGGGGGGGLLTGSISVTAQTYNVIVGGGGPRGTGVDNTGTGGGSAGTQGVNSTFVTLTAIGGGAGGTRNQNGGVGGSGGGGGDNGNTGGAGTAGQGYAGGNGPGMNSNSGNDSGGGGGAGGAGVLNVPGPGLFNALGNATFSAGGRGAQLITPADGAANTGNGGTGARAGGSGIAVVRYLATSPAPTSTTGSPTVTGSGLYQIYTWTVSGSITFGATLPSIPVTTKLLMPLSGGIGNNTSYMDSSVNTLTISRSGTTAVTCGNNPFNLATSGSLFFNYDSSVSIPHNTVLNMGGTAWTMELWFYPLGDYGNYRTMFAKRGTTCAYELYLRTSSGVFSYYNGTNYESTITPTACEWHHGAATFSSGTLKLWLDGVNVGTWTGVASTDNGDVLYVGAYGAEYFGGYVTNLRLVTGSVLYTTAFTPSTIPLVTVTGTSLLLLAASAGVPDYSKFGTPLVPTSNPVASSAVVKFANSRSVYLNGASMYTIYDNRHLNFSTGDFTVEAWVYMTGAGSANFNPLIDTRGSAISTPYIFFIDSRTAYNGNKAGPIICFFNGTTYAGNTIVTLNTWHHVAWSRTAGSLKFFLDGTLDYTVALTAAVNVTGTSYIFYSPDPSYFQGYANDFRIMTGVGLYTASFTPKASAIPTLHPELADAYSGYNTMLCHFEGPNSSTVAFFDSSNFTALTQSGGASISTTQFKYGTSSLLLTRASSQYLSASPGNIMTFGTSDFTIEAWVRLSSMPTSDAWPSNWTNFFVLCEVGSPSLGDGFNALIGQTVMAVQNNDTQYGSAVHGMVINTWYHLAYVRYSGVIYFYVNGVQKGSVAFAGAPGTGSTFYIGCETGQGAHFDGYIDDLRITKNIARYTAAFTPPAAALPDI